FQTARAKFASVSAAHLSRDTDRPAVRSPAIKCRGRRNHNGLDQISIDQTKEKLPRSITGTDHPHEVDLAEGKCVRKLCPQQSRQISHFIDGVDALFVKPLRDLSGAICGFAQFANLVLELAKQERLDIGFPGDPHYKIYRTPELASNMSRVRFVAVSKRFALRAVLFLAVAWLLSACASEDAMSGGSGSLSSTSSTPVPGEKISDEGAFTPGGPGASGSVHW